MLQCQRTDWQALRKNLIAGIRTDTVKAVTQIARKEGWVVAPEGDPAAADVDAERCGIASRTVETTSQIGGWDLPIDSGLMPGGTAIVPIL